MEEGTIFEKIEKYLSSELEIDANEITLDANLSTDLKVDSLDKYEFGYAMEDEFEIKIPDEKMQELKTVRDYVGYINLHK